MRILEKDLEMAERCFKRHSVELMDLGEIKIVDFCEKDSKYGALRYTFDKNFIHITGDLGEAIFVLTWEGSPYEDWNNTSLDYFHSKLKAFDRRKIIFCPDKAVSVLKEFFEENKEGKNEEEIKWIEKFIEDVKDSNVGTIEEWISFVDFEENQIGNLDQNAWSWIYDIGNTIPNRVKLYLLGLRRISKELKIQKTINEATSEIIETIKNTFNNEFGSANYWISKEYNISADVITDIDINGKVDREYVKLRLGKYQGEELISETDCIESKSLKYGDIKKAVTLLLDTK